MRQTLQEVQPENTPPQLIRESMTTHKASQRYPPLDYIFLTNEGELECSQECCKVETSKECKKATEEEMGSLLKKKTWGLVKPPKGRNILY